MGEIFSGGTLGVSTGQSPEQFAEILLSRLKKRLPDVEGLAIERVHLGVRPVPLDGYPVVGAPATLPGNGERSPLLRPFHPDRFS